MVLHVKVWCCSGMAGSWGTWNMMLGGGARLQVGRRLSGRNQKSSWGEIATHCDIIEKVLDLNFKSNVEHQTFKIRGGWFAV